MTTRPKESDSQRIGQEAKRALWNSLPKNWRLNFLDGDDDAGLDAQVQVIEDSEYTYAFRMQLKGSESTKLNADETFSVPLKASTLNYYADITEPIMLVFCDMSANDDPRLCPVYFEWITDLIRQRLDGKEYFDEDQKTYTFHVSKANQLTLDTNVIPYLEYNSSRHKVSEHLFSLLEGARSAINLEPVEAVTKMAKKIAQTGGQALLHYFAESPEPWPHAAPESIAGRLYDVSQQIKNNRLDVAATAVARITGEIESATDHERAELYYLNAKILDLQGDYEGAVRHHELAYNAFRVEKKYFIAYVESKVALESETNDKVDFSKILEQIPDSEEKEYLLLKAKYLAANNQFEAAEQAIAGLPGHETSATRALIAFFKREWSSVVDITDEAVKQEGQPDWKLITLYLLNARAHFYIGIADVDFIDGKSRLPFFGSEKMSLDELQMAWDSTSKLLQLLKKNGWPKTIEYLLDILGVAGSVLGKVNDFISDIRELARTRRNETIWSGYEQLCIASGDKQEAFAANKELTNSPEVLVRRIIIGHEAGYKRESLQIAEAYLHQIPEETTGYEIALAVSIVAADELIRPDLKTLFRQKLSSKAEWADELVVCDYVLRTNNDVLGRQAAVDDLKRAYEASPSSLTIQLHLFFALNPSEIEDAKIIVDITSKVIRSRNMGYEFNLVAAQAMITLRMWVPLIKLAENTHLAFPRDPKPFLLKAIAFDAQGQSDQAMAILKEGINTTSSDKELVNGYVTIAARCGFVDNCIDLVETLIEQSHDKKSKLQKLQLLYNLEMYRDPGSARIEEISWKFGTIADRENEKEEGLFLQMYLFSTIGDEPRSTPERISEFQARTREFFARFPESEYLRLAEVRTNSPEELFKTLRKISGITEERQQVLRKHENLLKTRQAYVPFCWRPRVFLAHVRDEAQLWELSKRIASPEFELNMAAEKEPEHPVDGIPLIDLVSLLVLNEVQLLGKFFRFFHKVAIRKAELIKLQNLTHPMLGIYGITELKAIQGILRENNAKILQLGQHESDDLRDGYDELKALLREGHYIYYSDDGILRTFIKSEDFGNNVMSCCSYDLICSLEQMEVITSIDAARYLADLIKLNISGVPVLIRHLIASVPDELVSCRTVGEAFDCLTNNERTNLLITSLLHYSKELQEIMNAVTGIVCYLIQRGSKDREEIITAFWKLWLLKVRFVDRNVPNIETYMAASLIRIVNAMDEDEVNIKSAWSCYHKLVESHYGNRMDEEKEREAIRLVAKMAATQSRAFAAESGALYHLLVKGFTPGTSWSDLFKRSFESAAIERASQAK